MICSSKNHKKELTGCPWPGHGNVIITGYTNTIGYRRAAGNTRCPHDRKATFPAAPIAEPTLSSSPFSLSLILISFSHEQIRPAHCRGLALFVFSVSEKQHGMLGTAGCSVPHGCFIRCAPAIPLNLKPGLTIAVSRIPPIRGISETCISFALKARSCFWLLDRPVLSARRR